MGPVSYVIGTGTAFYWSLKAQAPLQDKEPMVVKAFTAQESQTLVAHLSKDGGVHVWAALII